MQLFVDQLINVDFSYLDPERGLLGETWNAGVIVNGELDHQGMICDFGIVKKTLRNWLDLEIDHRLLVPTLSDALIKLESTEEIVELEWRLTSGEMIICRCPPTAIHFVEASSINPETVANSSVHLVSQKFEANVKLELSFSPEQIDGAFYHYSHGLKKHQGNCQRIAHGHRSRINIWKNDQRSQALEQEWAERFKDIYLASREDICDDKEQTLGFSYQSLQGRFFLELPKQHCYLMDSDTTVEFIAEHIASELKKQHPADSITVKAYEGLNKGAIARY